MTGSAAAVTANGNRWSRLSDWLNPIVVREVQQALRGRVFMLAVLAALVFVVGIALFVAADFEPMRSSRSGRHAFNAGLATLVPLLMFVTPMGAYQSMRHELRGGMVEQLLLSELRPRRIIFGKLTAAMVQFVLYVSVIAPLLAASYLLQGVTLPTIGVSLLFALVFCVTATAFAISSAAQGMLPALQGFASLAVALGLGLATMALIGFVASGEYIRDLGWLLGSNEFTMVASLIVLGGAFSCILSGLIAASFLAHAHENKSSGFRLFLFLILVVAFGWVTLFVDPSYRDEVSMVGSIMFLIGGAVFAIFMVTEQKGLSPRVAAHVPRSPVLAVLVAPFLPGRHRGLLCFLLFVAVLIGFAALNWPSSGRYPSPEEVIRMGLFIGAYCVIYLSLGKVLRSRLPRSVQGNYLARAAVPLALIAFSLLPVLVDVLVQGRVYDWHMGHALDPFWTIGEHAFRDRGHSVLTALLALAGVLLLMQLPGMLGGVGEVLHASRQRRRRQQPPSEATEAEGAA